MVKLNKKIGCALLLAVLVGCQGRNTQSNNSSLLVNSTNTVSTNNNTSTGISVSSSVSVSVSTPKDDEPQQDFPVLSEIQTDISMSGALIDLNVDLMLATGTDVQFGFGFNDITIEGATVTTTHPNILKYEYVDGRHMLKALKAGKSYLVIKDYEGFIHYRKAVTVSNPLTEENVYDHLFNVDIWHSWLDTSTLVFLENQCGTFKEADEFSVKGSFSFKYKLDRINYDTNEFEFLFTEVTEKTVEWTPVGFNLSLCGDIIHLMDTNMLAGVFQAKQQDRPSWN